MLAIIVFILVFGLIVLVHELGHFLAAKWAGVAVEEFGIGFPPRLWSIKRKGTVYSINWIPFGGFVRLKGDGKQIDHRDSLSSRSALTRLGVAVAGVLMNFFLGFLVLLIGFYLGMPPIVTHPKSYVGEENLKTAVVIVGVDKNQPAYSAGFKPGDVVLRVKEKEIVLSGDLVETVSKNPGRALSVLVKRKGEEQTLTVTPALQEGKGSIGVIIEDGITKVRYSPFLVPYFALQEALKIVSAVAVALFNFIVQLFTKGVLPPDLAGPVGIAKLTAEILTLGFFRLLQFVVLLTINLGILNILPFPALDGGRIVFVLLELVRGRRLPVAVENLIHSIGFVLLMILILVVTYRDILKLFI